MPINSDKPHLWKADVARSIDYYNDWFLRFAPQVYRQQRQIQTEIVLAEMKRSNYLRQVDAGFLKEHPGSLQVLRMATAPPLARDRLIGLAYVTPNLVKSMEGRPDLPPRIPPRIPSSQLDDELGRISEVLGELIDIDIFPWLSTNSEPSAEEVNRAASVLADRLCGAISDPIIRNAQEQRQKGALRAWFEANQYQYVQPAQIVDITQMHPGTFTFGYNIPVQSGARTINITVDCIVSPLNAKGADLPIVIEAKSAGDFTNTNKRRKEEAQKLSQLHRTYGSHLQFILFLCGYFDSGYLGYEAAEGIDWVWEHHLQDLSDLLLDVTPSAEKSQPPNLKESGQIYQSLEDRRLELQRQLDSQKAQDERNRLGQFATPSQLAQDILKCAYAYVSHLEEIDFLEPALGTGAFYSAMLSTFPPMQIGECRSFEVDPHYGIPAQHLWAETNLQIQLEDFTAEEGPSTPSMQVDLLATNPPYVRHHHLSSIKKQELQDKTYQLLGIRPSKLSGLYTYFIYLAHAWLRDEGIGAWLIPTEFMDVNYGALLREYLLTRVTLLRIHRFSASDVQFDDALVSSAVVIYRKSLPDAGHEVEFSYGGSVETPTQVNRIPIAQLIGEQKWPGANRAGISPSPHSGTIRIGDLFDIKRGIATGANDFFMVDQERIEKFNLPSKYLTPVLPSPRYLEGSVIHALPNGQPDITAQMFVLSCPLAIDQIRVEHPGLWSYLQVGIKNRIDQRYLCRQRSPWYLLEYRKPAPFICSYMGRVTPSRANPFRFFLNHSIAITANVFLNLYPTPMLQKSLETDETLGLQLLEHLNAIEPNVLVANGRTYGGSLHKLEPKELANVPIPELAALKYSRPMQYSFSLE
ncbi:MAG: XamI family restriction endonuclease [Caldilineaceae bacterium]|nr:XamI family restriction endonuclease [Caldilineaceae bacterium]